MTINYKLAVFVYSPVLLLLLISIFKDRFVSENKIFRLCTWSLLPASAILFLLLSEEEVKSLWYAKLVPFLKDIPYSPASLEIFNALFYCLLLLIVYLLLRLVYKVRIAEVFNLDIALIPSALKICGVLATINIISIYLLDMNLMGNPQKSILDFIRTMDRPHLALFLFSAIVVAPIVEESIFRGLIYAPLYRKVGRYAALFLSSLFWSQVHFEPLLTSIGIFVMGLFLGWLYDRSGSLLTPIILHSFKNSWVVYYLLK